MEMCDGIHFNNILCIFVEIIYCPKMGAVRQYYGLLSRHVFVRYVVSDAIGGVNKGHSKCCTQLPLACKSLTAVRTARRS
jgi:hypothetical protein